MELSAKRLRIAQSLITSDTTEVGFQSSTEPPHDNNSGSMEYTDIEISTNSQQYNLPQESVSINPPVDYNVINDKPIDLTNKQRTSPSQSSDPELDLDESVLLLDSTQGIKHCFMPSQVCRSGKIPQKKYS